MVKNVFSPGTVAKSSEVNENFEYVEALAAKGMAQVPYTTLKATAEWENEGYLGADRFTTASGVNGTIIENSTNRFLNNSFQIYFTNVNQDGTIVNENNDWYDVENAFDSDENTSAKWDRGGGSNIQTKEIGKTFSERFIKDIRIKATLRATNTSTVSGVRLTLYTFDGSSWSLEQVLLDIESGGNRNEHYDDLYRLNRSVQGIKLQFYSRNTGTTAQGSTQELFLLDYGPLEESELISQPLKIDSDDKIISLYSDFFKFPSGLDDEKSEMLTVNENSSANRRSSGIKCIANKDIIIIEAKKTPNTQGDLFIRDVNGNILSGVPFIKKDEIFFVTVNSEFSITKFRDTTTSIPFNTDNFNVIGSGESTARDLYDFTGTDFLRAIESITTQEVDLNSSDTNVKASISDGTLETDEFELQANKSTIIPLLDNMQGDMKIKFILSTTDPTKSPELYGYGVYKN